jgi:pyruvate/2-oxoglutarate dehydrogenase complex dihydrolipoamide dehydrogenase (E3) component
MDERECDVVVIGAGPAGENVADRVCRGGLSVVVVESELVGGECSYWACVPSKAMLRPWAALTAARSVDGAREAVTGDLDATSVLARRTRFTHGWTDQPNGAAWLEQAGLELIRGRARLAGGRRVEIVNDDGSAGLLARHAVVIATGSSAAIPPIPGMAADRVWTSREATSAGTVPARLAIIGGGVVACEMATAWQALGAEVTMLVRGPDLLPRVEPFAGELVAASLRSAGVTVRTNVNVLRIRRLARATPAEIWTSASVEGQAADLVADELLVAVGRTPRTAGLGLDTVGLSDGQWLTADDSCLVGAVPGGWLYAVGDVNGRNLLTHMGKYQARACGDAIVARALGDLTGEPPPWSGLAATADHLGPPQVIFTQPEVAAVGLTEAAAASQNLPVRAVDYEISDVSGAQLSADGYAGRARFVVDERRKVLVGATFVGPGTGELLHSATVAIVGEVPLGRLWHAVPSFPTISEVFLRLLETYGL